MFKKFEKKIHSIILQPNYYSPSHINTKCAMVFLIQELSLRVGHIIQYCNNAVIIITIITVKINEKYSRKTIPL